MGLSLPLLQGVEFFSAFGREVSNIKLEILASVIRMLVRGRTRPVGTLVKSLGSAIFSEAGSASDVLFSVVPVAATHSPIVLPKK